MSQLTIPVSDKDHIRGKKDAPVTLLEYGDFECPYCGQAYPVIQDLREKMGNTMRFVFRNFPLSQVHPYALHAAYAAEASGMQGKFWEMHDIIYENQDALTDEDLMKYAEELDLDIQQFVSDFDSDAISEKVQSDFMSGVRSGVNGTPTFFINGARYNGENDFGSLLEALQSAAHAGRHKGVSA